MKVMPKLFAGLIVSLVLSVPAFALETFTDEAKAQKHCPKDVVVWLNLPTMIWHWKGQRLSISVIFGQNFNNPWPLYPKSPRAAG